MNAKALSRRAVLRAVRPLGLVMALVLLVSCGGGGTTGGSAPLPPAAQDGSIVLSLNDAAGDFASYVVRIDQVKFTRDDGTAVLALPDPLTVDIAQLADASQILGSISLPAATYTSMAITIDYSNADIAAQNAQGQIVTLLPVTQSGATAGTISVNVQFTADNAIVVQQAKRLLTSLDFDLAASSEVDFGAAPATVTVTPLLSAVANPAQPPYAQASGTLTAVNTSAPTFTIDISPLFNTGSHDFGSLVIAPGPQTAYLVDGTAYSGAAGLQAMKDLGTGKPSLAYGHYSASRSQFMADEVYAGSSVPGVDSDMVHGSVVGRRGILLTVRGLTYIQSTGVTLFHTTATVSLGMNSVVYRAGNPALRIGADNVSVGQQVTILGSLTDATPSSLSLDAGLSETGYVRLERSQVSGTVNTTSPDMVLNLSEINHHPISWYDFTGTGSASSVDTDSANYEVDTGLLSLSGLAAGKPVEIEGFVQTFGRAPPDFYAQSIDNFASKGAVLTVAWRPDGTTTPFSIHTTRLVIDLHDTNIGPVAMLRRGGIPVDLTSLPASPAIVAPTGGMGVFIVNQGGTVTQYAGFNALMDALQSRLTGSTTIAGLIARGGFDAASNTFTATSMSVTLQ